MSSASWVIYATLAVSFDADSDTHGAPCSSGSQPEITQRVQLAWLQTDRGMFPKIFEIHCWNHAVGMQVFPKTLV